MLHLADRSVFTGSDMEILKKECQDLDNLLIPACKVDLMMVLGEGIVNSTGATLISQTLIFY